MQATDEPSKCTLSSYYWNCAWHAMKACYPKVLRHAVCIMLASSQSFDIEQIAFPIYFKEAPHKGDLYTAWLPRNKTGVFSTKATVVHLFPLHLWNLCQKPWLNSNG